VIKQGVEWLTQGCPKRILFVTGQCIRMVQVASALEAAGVVYVKHSPAPRHHYEGHTR
jgi:hypothetical protein